MREIATNIFCALSLLASFGHPIYVPNDVVDKKTLNTLGIKTLGWQYNNERVTIHHNYSKVSGFSPHQPPPSEEETTEFTTERIKWQRINDQLTELATQDFGADQKSENQSELELMAQEWQTLGSTDQRRQQQTEHGALLKTINDHLSKFDQLTQNFNQSDQWSSNLDQEETSQSSRSINDHLSAGFDQEIQGQKWTNLGGEGITQINDQLSGFGGRHDQDLGQEGQASGFDQKPQWSNLDQEESRQSTISTNDHLSGFGFGHEIQRQNLGGEGITHINSQLSGFGNNHHDQEVQHFGEGEFHWSNENNNDQTPFTQQHVNYYDGRQFTNAHGGYQPIRSDKLTQARPNVYYDEPIAYKKCPERATGQFAYELSCNQFLNCWKGRGYVQNCAPGTLFNPRTLECDFPDKVACVSGPRQMPFENREPLSSALQATCPPDFTGIIPHYVDCSKFINCVNGVEFHMSCPPGTLFDVRTNLCDHAYKVECANQEAASDSRFHHGFANQYIMVKPYREGGANATYQRQYLTNGAAALSNQHGRPATNINDHLDEFVRQLEVYGATNQSSASDAFGRRGGTTSWNYSTTGYGTGAPDHFGGSSRGTNQFEGSSNQFGSDSTQFHQHGSGSGQFSGGSNQFGLTTTSNHGENQHGGSFHQFGGGSNQFGQTTSGSHGRNELGGNFDHLGTGSNQFGETTSSQNHHGGSFSQFGGGSNQFGQPTTSNINGQNQHGGRFDHLGSGSNQFGQSTSSQDYFNQFGGGSNQFGQTALNQNVGLFDLGKEIRSLGLDASYCTYHPGFSEHPRNCSLFLFCDNGNLLLFPCEAGSFFNPTTQACDLNYRCPKLAANQEYVPSAARPKCPSNYNGLLPHPTVCAKFLNCHNGQTFVQDCGPGTVFNPGLKACDYPYRVRCVDQEVPKRNQGYQTDELRCPQGEAGLFPHPTNCSKFLNCANGQTHVQECGQGTVFNPHFKICDYPHRVNCGQKAIGPTANNQNQNWDSGNQTRAGWSWGRGPNRYNQSGLYGGGDQFGAASQNQNWWSSQNQNNQSTSWNQSGLYDGADQTGESSQNRNWWAGQNQDNQWQVGGGNLTDGSSQNHNWWTGQNQNNQWQVTGGNQTDGSSQNRNWWTGQNQNNQWQVGGKNQTGGTSHTRNWWADQNQDNPWQVAGRNQSDGSSHTRNWWAGQNQNKWQVVRGNQSNLYDGADQTGASSQNRNWWAGRNQNNQWQVTRANQSFNNFGVNHQNQTQQWNRNWYNEQGGSGVKPQPIGHTWPNNRGANQDSSFKHSPPPFPSTDTNADYVFEYDDAGEMEVPERKRKNFCQIDDFRCSDNLCISQSMVCDTYKDCPDGNDEVNCEKYVEQFASIPGTKMAVREKGKFPNVTLTLCAKYCMESKGFQCKAFNYRKNDGMCFIFDTNVGLSGSLFMFTNYDYYEYRKFTVDCSAKHKCANQKCIDFEQVCDGVNDCGDRGDEKGCKAEQLGYSVRLVGSGKPHEGVVEVSAFGRSGYICDDMFGLRDAHVLCKELGFPLGALEVHGNSYFAPQAKPNETFYMMDDVTCLGNETSLRDCDFSGWGVHNCMEQEIIGVVCKTPLEKCPKDYWRCETGNECLPLAFVCDAVDDCEDKSDEGSQYCEAPIELRLVGGRSKLEGRVEINYHGTWGTICDDDFNDDAAKVVCKYLGHEGAAIVKKDGYFGKGEGPIWLDQIYCQGNETAIQECLHWDWGEHNCEHSEDVGVVCSDAADYESFHIEAQRNAKLPPLPEAALIPERCGYRSDAMFLENDDVHFRVVKGSAARKGDYPWQASLRVKGKTKPSHWCGAVVVSQRFVLTAAHCLDGFTKGAYIVVAGDYNVDVDEGSEQVAYIEDFYTHEQFRNGTRMNNDIALIKLKGDGFNITREVQPICLPAADFDREKEMNCTISGFGSIQSGKAVASKELRAGWIPIQARDVCGMPHIYGDAVTEGMICAGSLDEGVDACDGDSGGPLACLHNGLFTLVGITSWGQHCGYANKPGVYVRVAHYRNWIDSTMEKHS